AYELIVPIPDVPSSVPMVNPDELRSASMEGLDKMKRELEPLLPENTILASRAENHLLPANIDQVAKQEEADLIVMGITGGSQLEEILVGSNTIDVVKHTTCPVIIVPGSARFRPIRKIVFACDFRKVVETTPVQPLKKLLNVFKPELHVLNIDHESKHFTSDTPYETLMLDTLLEGYDPQFHFIDHTNVVQGIMDFAAKQEADLILIIPKKHGLFDHIFKRSRTTQLAFHTHVPLLAIHE
ncbi:MAG TPA: universal stress protein, partial [Chitinophaga sp.]